MVELSIVIPIYKAEGCLERLHERLTTVLSSTVPSYEIILIDDSSPDDCWSILKALAIQDTNIRAYRLSRNFGQHAAITAGLEQCQGRYAVVMDCDLQDPPEIIPQLYHQAIQGSEVVLARRKTKRHSFFRRTTSKLYFQLLNLIIHYNRLCTNAYSQ